MIPRDGMGGWESSGILNNRCGYQGDRLPYGLGSMGQPPSFSHLFLLCQNFRNYHIRKDHAAGHVKGPFKRASLSAGHGRKPVPAEIAIPFPIFRVRETGLAVVQSPIEPIQIFLIFRVPVKHQGGD